jgi:ribosomal protein S6--L-glutamate ligase
MLDKVIVGSEEWCSFPTLGIPTIKARVDSGAKTSALHAINIVTFEKDSENWVKFDINPIQNNAKAVIHCEAPLVDKRVVKSSSGFREQRYVIKTKLEIGGKTWEIEVTLTNRDSMGFRMLLGREAMSGRVLVDPEQRYLLGQPTTEKLKEYYNSRMYKINDLEIILTNSKSTKIFKIIHKFTLLLNLIRIFIIINNR